MTSRELLCALRKLSSRDIRSQLASTVWNTHRYASAGTAAKDNLPEDFQELDDNSSLSVEFPKLDARIEDFDPIRRSNGRRRQLPPSRYQFRPPRYYRGPLHPHQPPPKTDPASREFIPGPFSRTRLDQTYQATIASDLMTLMYVHQPPGTVASPRGDRLRSWDDSSPYHKGRPKRGPRGPGSVLRLIERHITWKNIPKIEEITVHSFVKGASDDSAYLHVAGMTLQAVTGVRPTVHYAKHSVSHWGLRQGTPIALSATMHGNMAYEFLDKCIHLVFPRLKDWPGIKGTTGDSSGNLAWGFNSDGVILFPEVQVNYDMYPPKMIPGFHVLVKTTATSDRHARLLLAALGVPFYGKLID